MKTILSVILATAGFVFGLPTVALASEKPQVIDGVTFQAVFDKENTLLKLRGVATLKYLVVIRAYAGALYLPEDVDSRDVLTDVPKRLVLEYFHAITADDLFTATQTMIEKNTTPAIRKTITNELNLLSKTYKDIQPHDRYALTYRPGYGTELALNDTRLETFKGAVFAKAIFSIWLGDHPISPSFKKRLTNQK